MEPSALRETGTPEVADMAGASQHEEPTCRRNRAHGAGSVVGRRLDLPLVCHQLFLSTVTLNGRSCASRQRSASSDGIGSCRRCFVLHYSPYIFSCMD
jgi:hypothetical protein